MRDWRLTPHAPVALWFSRHWAAHAATLNAVDPPKLAVMRPSNSAAAFLGNPPHQPSDVVTQP